MLCLTTGTKITETMNHELKPLKSRTEMAFKIRYCVIVNSTKMANNILSQTEGLPSILSRGTILLKERVTLKVTCYDQGSVTAHVSYMLSSFVSK